LKRRRRTDEDDEEYDRPAASRPWWWQLMLRRPRDTLAGVVAAGAVIAIIVNGVYLQHGRHPAPIFAIKPLPVAASRDTVGSLQRPHAAMAAPHAMDHDAARHDLVPAAARPTAVELPRPRPATAPAAPARKDAIADLLGGHNVQSQPHVQPPARQAALPAAPPAIAAPVPPAPIPAPSRSLAQPSRQVLAVQRALSDFGYGQLKPTGLMDEQTRSAIKQFQSARNLQPTGELNDQVKRELAGMVGHELN
jgi:putative peptidoglycan binding protein